MTTFDEITCEVEHGDAFTALFRQAESQLRAEKADGYNVVDIGRRAWSRLPVSEYGRTLESFFYCYWLVDRDEREATQQQAAVTSGDTRLAETDQQRVVEALAYADVDGEGDVRVPFDALQGVVAELKLLQDRLSLLADTLSGGAR